MFVLTPESKSIYSWVEVTTACITQPQKTVLCVLKERNGKTYEGHEEKAVLKSIKDLQKTGAVIVGNLNELAKHLNTRANTSKR